jgi:hypothetical protein
VKEKKMKHKFLLFAVMLLVVGLFVPATYSQIATFKCWLGNSTIDATGKIYEVDIYLQRTGTDVFELYAFQGGFLYDNNVKNGGTLTLSWVPNSQDSLNAVNRGNTLNAAVAGCIKIAPKISAGFGTGTIISPAGTKIGRLRVTNSVAFLNDSLKLVYSWVVTPYATKIACYDPSTTLVVDNTDHGFFYFGAGVSNLVLPVELTTFASTVSGRQVNLSWETKTEVNSNKFEIDRGLVSPKDASVTWTSVGTVSAAGNSNSPKKYSYTEKNVQSGKYQYRLKMIDNDGSFKYSNLVETMVALPKEFAISQNYPNPFNPSTKIDYQVPVDAKVILEVYNIAGQKVVDLVNQDQQAGYYSVSFGSSNKLASGVYIYRMVATEKATGNNFSNIKKMMLLK